MCTRGSTGTYRTAVAPRNLPHPVELQYVPAAFCLHFTDRVSRIWRLPNRAEDFAPPSSNENSIGYDKDMKRVTTVKANR